MHYFPKESNFLRTCKELASMNQNYSRIKKKNNWSLKPIFRNYLPLCRVSDVKDSFKVRFFEQAIIKFNGA
jgi:hypothetical protein